MPKNCFLCDKEITVQTDQYFPIMTKDGVEFGHENCMPSCSRCGKSFGLPGSLGSGALCRSGDATKWIIEHVVC
jgi:hypothetical protein